MLLLLLQAIFLSTQTDASHLSCGTYEEAYRSIDHLISEKPYLIPPLVRLAFHDCKGHSCDGCLNFHEKTNKGLEEITHLIDSVWSEYWYKSFSRSDWWQLASHVALIRGGLNKGCHSHDHECHFFYLQYWWGRHDCHSSPFTKDENYLPDGSGDVKDLWDIFDNFKLNEAEGVALLGCHSLGGAHVEKSGYKFNWQKNYLTFDNTYYKNLLYLPYEYEEVSKGKKEFVWYPHDEKHEEPLLMLSTDISLWKKTKSHGDYNNKELTCPIHGNYEKVKENTHNFISHCDDAPTTKFLYEYAHDLKKFYDVFSVAWWKMVSNGYQDEKQLLLPGVGHEECGHCIPKGAYCVPGFELSGKCCKGLLCEHNHCI